MTYYCGDCGKECSLLFDGFETPRLCEPDMPISSLCCDAQVYSDKELKKLADAADYCSDYWALLGDRQYDEWREMNGQG